jgi:serine/threonine protein kinase
VLYVGKRFFSCCKTRFSVSLQIVQDEPRFEADVYALGMCMVEAITQEIPFGVEDDDAVTVFVLAGELPPRPQQATDGGWDFICSLCAENYRARPSIDEVIASLSASLENSAPWVVAAQAG